MITTSSLLVREAKVLCIAIIAVVFLFSANIAVEPTQEQHLMNSTLDIDNDRQEAAVAITDPRSGNYSSENVQKIAGKAISQWEIFGDSMLPTLATGDVIYIAANETFETIQPGKVVVFRTLKTHTRVFSWHIGSKSYCPQQWRTLSLHYG
jgi:hypothetical protein